MAEIAQGIGGALQGATSGAAIGTALGGPILGTAAGALIGGIGGLLSGNSQKKKAEALAAEIDAMISELGLPPETAGPLLLEKFKQEGLYTPEIEQAINLEASKVAQIQEDPALRDTQMKGLELISGRAEMGLSPEDRAELAAVMDQTAQQTRGQEEAIIQNMQQRGQGGSGAELAARLASGQSSANRATSSGNEIAAAASRNALQAASQMGQLGGQIRSQDFDVNQTRSQAEDERNKLLYNNSVSLQERNINRANEAAKANLARQQAVADSNVGMNNAEIQRQNQAKLDDYNARVGYTNARIGAKTGNAGRIQAGETAGRTQFADVMTGLGGASSELAKLMSKDKPVTAKQVESASAMTESEKRRRGLL